MNDTVVDLIFVMVTGAVAWHGLSFRDKKGDPELVHMLFGAISAMYCLWILMVDLLGIF